MRSYFLILVIIGVASARPQGGSSAYGSRVPSQNSSSQTSSTQSGSSQGGSGQSSFGQGGSSQSGSSQSSSGQSASSQTSSGSSSVPSSVMCQTRQVGPGKFEFDCHSANPGTIIEEKTLWIPTFGNNQDLLVHVPNYKLHEIIRAGLTSNGTSNTNVRIHVDRPHVDSQVEGQFDQHIQVKPVVQVTYDGITNQAAVHYGNPGSPYAALSKQISEPGETPLGPLPAVAYASQKRK